MAGVTYDEKVIASKTDKTACALLITVIFLLVIAGIGVTLVVVLNGDDADDEQPNIIFIMADDLGWNDIGYNNEEVITPNLDRLAEEGRKLTSNYVVHICTPSRHAFLSGRYPFATTMQNGVLSAVAPHCSPLDLEFLPQKLQELGYETATVGKWHIGYCRKECTPMERGFDHQYGLMHGSGDYYELTLSGLYDFRDNMATDWSLRGTYSTFLFRDRIKHHIEEAAKPLFVFGAFTTPHEPLQVPEEYEEMYADIEDEDRRIFLGMVSTLDEAVGEIEHTLKETGKWDNTLLVFISDNGGESGGHSDNAPLRGCKASLWEGGTRVVGFVSGGAIRNAGESHDGLFHVVDWMPTLLHVAGGPSDGDGITTDGLDQYDMIINGGPSVRDEIVYNIDMEPGSIFGQAAIRVGDYKLIWGHEGLCDGWGIDVPKFWNVPEQCLAAGLNQSNCPAFLPLGQLSPGSIYTDDEIFAQAVITARKRFEIVNITSGIFHLFNLADDPYETNDLADDPAYSDIVIDLKQNIINKVNNDYVAPPLTYYETRLPITEANPLEPSQSAWGIGFCNDLDLTMPTK